MGLPIDTIVPIAYPPYYKTIGELQEGDIVFGRNGVDDIDFLHPVDLSEDTYEIEFDTGEKIITDGGQMWAIEGDIVSTSNMYYNLFQGGGEQVFLSSVSNQNTEYVIDINNNPEGLERHHVKAGRLLESTYRGKFVYQEGLRINPAYIRRRITDMRTSPPETTYPIELLQKVMLKVGYVDKEGMCCIDFPTSLKDLASDFLELTNAIGYKSFLVPKRRFMKKTTLQLKFWATDYMFPEGDQRRSKQANPNTLGIDKLLKRIVTVRRAYPVAVREIYMTDRSYVIGRTSILAHHPI